MKLRAWRVKGFYPYTHVGVMERDGLRHYWLGYKINSEFISDEDTHRVVRDEWQVDHAELLRLMYVASQFRRNGARAG